MTVSAYQGSHHFGLAYHHYFVWESQRFDYTISGINPYYRSILEMSQQGWPGGLRWLHAEDGLE